jgi:hypothetical protein
MACRTKEEVPVETGEGSLSSIPSHGCRRREPVSVGQVVSQNPTRSCAWVVAARRACPRWRCRRQQRRGHCGREGAFLVTVVVGRDQASTAPGRAPRGHDRSLAALWEWRTGDGGLSLSFSCRRRWRSHLTGGGGGSCGVEGRCGSAGDFGAPPYRGQRQSFQGPAKMRAVIGACWRQVGGRLLFFHLRVHFGGLLDMRVGDFHVRSHIPLTAWSWRH